MEIVGFKVDNNGTMLNKKNKFVDVRVNLLLLLSIVYNSKRNPSIMSWLCIILNSIVLSYIDIEN